MAVRLPNDKRKSSQRATTPQTKSQRSDCNLVIYRWKDADIAKVNLLEAASERGFEGQGSASTKGNLATKDRVVIKNDVVRCNITKSKSAPAGTFSIQLKRGKVVRGNQVQLQDINYLDVINPGDWIMIYIKKSGEIQIDSTGKDSGLKMVGIIENVRYTEIDDPETGKPTLGYVVTGQDFGKVFTNSIFFNPLLNPETVNTFLGAKFLTNSIKSLKGADRPSSLLEDLNPQNVIRKLLGFYLGKSRDQNGTNLDTLNSTNQTWYIPPLMASRFGVGIKDKSNGISFSDILQTDRIGLHRYDRNGNFQGTNQLLGATVVKSLPSSGNVWSVLNFMSNSAVNEMYTELQIDRTDGKLKPSFILRQVPFSNRPNDETNVFNTKNGQLPRTIAIGNQLLQKADKTYFVNLPRHSIVSTDIKQKNIGKSDHERINHLLVVPKIDFDAINVAFISAVNVASIQRYGLKSFQVQSNYVFRSKFGNPIKTCQAYVELLIDWFFLSHLFYNGTIIIDGKDEHIPVGDNLYISDIQQLFHVESLTHTYQVLPGTGGTIFETELSVSRGQFYDQTTARFIGPSSVSQEQSTIATSVLEGIR